MYRSIAVALSGEPSDDDAVRVAMDLAERHRAHVTLLQTLTLPIPDATAWSFASAASLRDLYAGISRTAAQAADRLCARFERDGVPLAVQTQEAWSSDIGRAAVDPARTADLVVAGGWIGGGPDATQSRRIVTALLFECGRPVLVVPPACRTLAPPGRAVVAWTPTREAARAVHDALPLLADTASVDILTIQSDVDGDKASGGPVARESQRLIVDHLHRHGVNAHARLLAIPDGVASMELLDHARSVHADLLVAGAYGHARMREWLLGGTTRELLLGADVPLLLAH